MSQDYESALSESWKIYATAFEIIGEEPNEAFKWVFKRAFALGKEKETISQEEIEEAAEDYVSFEKGGKCYPSYIVERACCIAFKDGANFAIGKQDKDADTVIQGWVARDEDGHLFMYSTKPEREETLQIWMGRYADFDLRDSLFPDLTWESEPLHVEIIIKRKKNG